MNDDNIFGYTWDEIRAAQQGQPLQHRRSTPITEPDIQADIDLLETHGMDGLAELGLFGVIDRLNRYKEQAP